MIPPVHASRAAAEHIEKLAHAQGWDQPPRLIQLRLHRVGEGTGVAEGSEVPFGDQIPSGNPAIYLRMMADQFGEGHQLSKVAKLMATPSFCGLAFCCESWVRTGKDYAEAHPMPGVSFADIPGSLEARHVCVVDTAGRLTSCQRIRGKQPEIWDGSEHSPAKIDGGRVPASLRDMVLAIALHMPFGTADLDALRGLKLQAER